MTNIAITLKANNSNGKHELHLTKNKDQYWFTLTGNYKGQFIQIDFEESTRDELEDMKAMLELILEHKQ